MNQALADYDQARLAVWEFTSSCSSAEVHGTLWQLQWSQYLRDLQEERMQSRLVTLQRSREALALCTRYKAQLRDDLLNGRGVGTADAGPWNSTQTSSAPAITHWAPIAASTHGQSQMNIYAGHPLWSDTLPLDQWRQKTATDVDGLIKFWWHDSLRYADGEVVRHWSIGTALLAHEDLTADRLVETVAHENNRS